MKTHFHIAVSVGRRSQPVVGVEPLGSERKAAIGGSPKQLLTGLFLAAFTIAALVVALVIGSVIALIVWGAFAITIVGVILRTSFRRTRQQERAPALPVK